MLTLYGIAFAPALKPYRTWPLFIDKNSDSGADFCNEAKLRRAYLQSHIGYGVHTILNSFSCWHKRRSSVVWTYSLSLVNLLCENALVSFGLYVYKLLESNRDWFIFCLHLSWITRGKNPTIFVMNLFNLSRDVLKAICLEKKKATPIGAAAV